MVALYPFVPSLGPCQQCDVPSNFVCRQLGRLVTVPFCHSACDAVDKFAALLDIRLDAQKRFTWCTDQAGRHELRSAVFRVVNATRDLASTLVSFPIIPRWIGFVTSLNPELQCCVVSLLFDPQVLAVTDTVRDARSLGCHSEVVLDFQEGPLGPEAPDYNSLSEILCQRLGQAGFHAGLTALARDLIGDFPFLTCAFGEFLARLQWSWTSVVAAMCPTACPSVDLNLLMWCIPGKPTMHLMASTKGFCGSTCMGPTLPMSMPNIGPTTEVIVVNFAVVSTPRIIVCVMPCLRILIRLSRPCQLLCRCMCGLCIPASTCRGSNIWAGLPRSFPIPSVPPPVRSWTFSRMAAVCIPEIPNVGLPRLLVHAAPVQLDYDPSGFKPLIAQPLAGVLESAYRTELQAIVVAPVGGRSVWGLGSHLVR